MILRKLTLINYGGIYNGMHLYDITIDFSKCKNRIIVLRGDNGSGKSTIESSLKPSPDSNDSFIPGKTAIKEIEYFDETANIIYSIKFLHECKPNGDRCNTKGYFKKIIVSTGEICELNPNGNITSCRDIIFEEFQLDPNYITLTQLSSGNRGIADMRPADRKKYINSILSNTEVYNDIHKKLSKKSLTYKGLMGSIVSKLGTIGDKAQLEAELINLNNNIENLSIINTESIKNKASAEGSIKEIDIDGSIINTISKIDSDLISHEKSLKLLQIEIQECSESLASKPSDYNYNCYCTVEKLTEDLNKLINEKSNLKDKINNLLETRELEASELSVKSAKLQSLNSGIDYTQCKSIIYNCKDRMSIIESKFNGIDVDNISQDEFVSIIETLHNIQEELMNYENSSIIIQVLQDTIPNIDSKINDIKNRITNLSKELVKYTRLFEEEERRKDLIKVLDNRPYNCDIDSCPFIKNAIKAKKEHIQTLKDYAGVTFDNHIEVSKDNLDKLEDELSYLNDYRDASVFIENICKQISNFYKSLPKVLKDLQYTSPKELIGNIYTKSSTVTLFDHLYNLLDQANDIEEYKVLEKQLLKSEMEIKSLESQSEFIELLEKDINNIQTQLDKDSENINIYNSNINELDYTIEKYKNYIENKKQFDTILDKINKIVNDINNLKTEKVRYSDSIEKINKYIDVIKQCDYLIKDSNDKLKPLLERREMINYQLNLMTQYIKELDEYKSMYNKIESLKYYSSPTTGIQLLFASMYMNKIMDNANRLLCNLFNGKFAFLPFIITENEFRIPVAVDDGINHEDITTMSSAEIMLLSMIISISLLSQTSTKLNIIVGDELDGPFDGDNRRGFFDILYKLMTLVSATQCVLISHNTELPSDCDVIILKNENSSERGNVPGNVIWSYYNQN